MSRAQPRKMFHYDSITNSIRKKERGALCYSAAFSKVEGKKEFSSVNCTVLVGILVTE